MSHSNQKKPKDGEPPTLGEIAFSDSGDIPGVTQLLTPGLANGRKSHASSNSPSEDLLISPPDEPQISFETPSSIDDEQDEEVLDLAEVEGMDFQEQSFADHESEPQSKDVLFNEIGVDFEIIFTGDGTHFTFKKLECTSPKSNDSWRNEFYSGMKLDLKSIPIQSDFQEFSVKSTPFQRDLFGIMGSEFVTCIRSSWDPNTVILIVSKASLGPRRSELESIYGAPRSVSTVSKNETPATASSPEVKKDYEPGDDDIKIEIA